MADKGADQGSSAPATEIAILAGGCFWCLEAVYDDLKGVRHVESGYIGGHVDNPSYRQVCGGDTGHAEAVKVEFDPAELSYEEMLDIFFHIHDPTTKDRQGNDVGPQYRSAIFPLSDGQRAEAEAAIERAGRLWSDPVVTTIEEGTWWPGEREHQDYYARTGDSTPYCNFVVGPKVRKFREEYRDKLKPGVAA
ncbi:peptide-methionine (S)-S-oxide reductase [Pacificimonas flava]|uniref:Peptide methionine sulfoxide reductase MsrA n=2 Tax=Pacificimonas TaxID=1960290 RepID=A0A219B2L0_9SPHN|nr:MULTISPECIES: peptide-methionine (S)-S-oxide reductase MsrA [Pacificimonas]MBZ6377988.1 peptide-methionine (S)-S-oxide reductase MsrA [Pacificimonas aurantium]OWV32366.1 peptide-methionine (S)-S-oxide reductase [Pacificimonas flava]